MELKYDPIYTILKQINNHPNMILKTKNPYSNVIQLFISDSIPINDASFYFPTNKLMVNRLPDSFVQDHHNLLEKYWHHTHAFEKNFTFKEVWATTAHLNTAKAFLIELSFE